MTKKQKTETSDYGRITLEDRQDMLELRNLLNTVFTALIETGTASCVDMHELDDHSRRLDKRFGFDASGGCYVVASLTPDHGSSEAYPKELE